jgi:hypothetical protein
VSAWTHAQGHGRPPVRWARRIAGVLGTAALFAVAIVVLTMILGQTGSSDEPELSAPPQASTQQQDSKAADESSGDGGSQHLTAAERKERSTAIAAVRDQGYEPVDKKQYDPSHTLRVLIAHESGDSAGPRRAFFFRGSDLVGTDSDAPSTKLKISGSGDDWATLSYGVYATGDQACCPSGGRVKVRFGLTGTGVAPVGGTMPASTQRVATG